MSIYLPNALVHGPLYILIDLVKGNMLLSAGVPLSDGRTNKSSPVRAVDM